MSLQLGTREDCFVSLRPGSALGWRKSSFAQASSRSGEHILAGFHAGGFHLPSVAVRAGASVPQSLSTVFSLLVYSVVKFRRRAGDDGREPPQIYGSNQVELAWTVIPVLIVVVLFLATARVIHAIEDARLPAGTTEVTAVGHQFWWEFQYPQQGFITANELHVPVSDPQHPTPTHITLLSADTDHSFWVPRLAGQDRPDSQPHQQHVDRSA